MLGYCSNSPLRCEHARSLIVLDQIDCCCPNCGLFLISTQKISHKLRAEERLLRMAFYAVAILLMIVTHIYYIKFV